MQSISALIETSRALERAGNIGEAFTNAELALENARATRINGSIVEAQVRVAFLHFRLGHYDRARNMAEEALALDAPDSKHQVDAWLVLGNCAAETNDLSAAEDSYLHAIDLSRQMGYSRAFMSGLHNLATGIYLPQGKFKLALAADQEVARLANEQNVPKLHWGALVTLAWIYWLIGQYARSAATLDELLGHASPGSLEEGYGHWLSGNLALESGDLEQVLPHFSRGRSIAEAIGEPGLGILVRLGPSRYHRESGDAAAAWEWAEDANTMAVRAGYHHLQGLALIERGLAAWSLNDTTAAEEDLLSAVKILQPLNIHFDLTRAYLYLAALVFSQKHTDTNHYWQQAAGLIQTHGFQFLLEKERALVLPWVADGLDSPDPEYKKTSQRLFTQLQNTTPASLQVKTLGEYSVKVGGRPIQKEILRQRRAGEVLAFLLASPKLTLTSQQIAYALCPEKDSRAATDFYHHAVSALRRMLEPDLPDRRFLCRYLDVSEEKVTLILPPDSKIDLLEFEKFFLQKDWASVLALYQGEYLPNYRYAEWAIELRQNFADRFELALLALAEENLNSGSPAACLELAQRALLHNAWQERAVALGMQAALQLNDRVTALKLYQRLEKKLSRDLGVAPESQLQLLYNQALKHTRPK
ncbi:MAG TPA: BTAD domain-containing putative transcriptional regulator [Anaerolineaceae bacterium]|nr:BTAD domain-containing putative transcriptional regulator [Anaerolineaceae bacterium]